jgi:hypothetical protein
MKLKHYVMELLVALLMMWGTTMVLAQEGHPLHGSWSGNRTVDGQDSRLLIVMELQRDQSITGYVIENRKKIPLKGVVLNPADWTVSMSLADDSYSISGKIGDLGSATGRMIDGSWTDGRSSGDFHLQIN